MRSLVFVLLALGLAIAAVAVFVRVRPLDPVALHVDPATVTPPAAPNHALLAGSAGSFIRAGTAEVAARIEAVADADGAVLLAGSPAEGRATYVVRSRIMGFPDIVTVGLTGQSEGTQVDLFSRSVYGWSDLGVNTVRAQRWMQAARGASVFSDGD